VVAIRNVTAYPTGMLLVPIGTPKPKGSPLWTPHLFVQWLSILLLHNGYTPARTGKTGTENCSDSGHISVPVLLSSGRESEQKALPSDKLE